jgi:hypothetical protein
VDTGFPPARSRAAPLSSRLNASAGEGRSENIMLKQKNNAKAHSILSFRFPMCDAVREKKPATVGGLFKSLRPDAYMLHPDAGHST